MTEKTIKKKDKEPVNNDSSPKIFAVVRIRGGRGAPQQKKKTMELLRIYKKNRCVLVPGTKQYLGMLEKVKDYITFGEVDKMTVKQLLMKRGRIVGNKPLTEEFLKRNKLSFDELTEKIMSGDLRLKDVDGLKPFFKLQPPLGGFERGGIKEPYSMHGALGYRKKKINRLLRRMM